MVICVDRVRKKTDKFLDTIYKSNPKNIIDIRIIVKKVVSYLNKTKLN